MQKLAEARMLTILYESPRLVMEENFYRYLKLE
jgi:hypothetical protein